MPTRYSKVLYTLDTDSINDPEFSYSGFSVLGSGADPESSQFEVWWNDTQLVLTTDYTVNTTLNTVTLGSTVTGDLVEGDVIAIRRATKKDARYVDWTDNAGITEQDLDLDGDQLLFIAQEAWDLANTALTKNAAETTWAGQGLESTNCAPATTGSGWVTLDQVNNLINGGDTATLGETNEWCFTGDGTTDDFVLNGAAANTTEENLFVTVDGVLLCPCDSSLSIEHPLAGKAYARLEGVPSSALTGSNAGAWDTAFDSLVSAVNTALDDASTSGLTDAEVASMTIKYVVYVSVRDTGTIPATAPVQFVGTASQCISYIATFDGDCTGWIDWYSVEAGDMAYSWNQATRTITFVDPPVVGADICIRQLTGTVAVDLADVSLDGSEIQDDAITIDHLDFAAGTAYRVLKVDAAGDPSVGTITSAYISDFTAAVNSLQWRSMTAPTGSVNLNSQKITSLQAGSSAGDAVNYGQLTAATDDITAIETSIAGGSSGDSSDTGLAVTPGIHPDLFYNNAENSRGALVPSSGATACAAEVTAGDSNLLMSGFVPRWLKIFISGDIRKDTDPPTGVFSDWVQDVSLEFEFLNWDVENGYTGVVSTEDSGNRKVYNLNVPKNHNASTKGDLDWPSPLAYGDVKLVIETISPYRVWLRLRDASDASRVGKITKYNDANLPGSLQVVAIKGL